MFLTTLCFLSFLLSEAFAQGYSTSTNGTIVSRTRDTTSVQAKWKSKNLAIPSPFTGDDLFGNHWEWGRDITIKKVTAVLVGSSTPSVTFTLRHATSRSAGGTEVTTGGWTVTSTTTSTVFDDFDDATVNFNEMIWLEVTDQSGVVDMLNITVYYYMGDIE